MTPPTKSQVKAGQIRVSKQFRILVGHSTARKQYTLWQWRNGAWAARKPRAAPYIVKRWGTVESDGNPIPTTLLVQDWRAEHDALLARLAGLQGPLVAPETQDMKTLCKAKGDDWQCDRAPTAAKGYCPGHYAQLRAEKPLTRLKGAHGALEVMMVTRCIQIPKEWDDLMVAAAGGPEGNVSQVFRELMAPHIETLRQVVKKG